LDLNADFTKNLGITGIVLAGGRGSRLGRQKALERIGEKSLIENTIDILIPLCQEVIVVTSKEQLNIITAAKLDVKIVIDIYPGKAALGGVYTGLANANTLLSLVVACDMPFLNRSLLRYMEEIAPGFDIVVPKVQNKIELLHAVYSKNCLDKITQLFEKNVLQILELLDLVKTRYVLDDEVEKHDPERLVSRY
jgi:molybdopterin-guanine dinucleotide biosynthesis protein A